MAVFSIPFTIPSNYFYDASTIEVTGGLAQLKESSLWNGIQVYYRAEEALWDSTLNEVIDSSDNNIHATAYDGANTIPVGKIGRCGGFDGLNDYVVSTNNIPVLLEGNPDFTVSFWVYVPTGATMTGGGYRQFFSFGGPSASSLAQITNYNVTPNRIYIGWYGYGGQYTSDSFALDTWVHIIWSRTGGGKVRDGNEVYFNNVSQSLITNSGTLNPNTLPGPFKLQRGVPTDARFIQCYMDEVCVWDRLLTSGERDAIYNVGAGDIIKKYADDKPTIFNVTPDTLTVGDWNNFSVISGTVEGSLAYQLSEDGVTWKYWNGSAWGAAVGEQYNIESVVNANIPSFPTAQNKIYVRTWLISDGFQNVEVDEIQVTYTDNFNPSVDAGTNKTCKDNQTIFPFLDCNFFDVDGTVDHAYYKVDGEVDIWTEISQGGYGTLLEAVQSFQYTFNNLGVQIVRLQAEDNLGATNEDDLEVDVEKYTKIVNVRDVVTDEHVINFDFNPGDGSGTIQQDSPFSWDWDYGNFDITLEKIFFYTKQQSILVENEDALNIYAQASAFLNENKASVGLMTEGDRLIIDTWFQQGGQLITNPTSCTVELYDQDDVLKFTGINNSPDIAGHFHFSRSPSGLNNEGVYHLIVTTIAGGIPFTNTIPIGLIERKLISFEGAVHIDIDNGSIGTAFPHGTPLHPVNNFYDAKIIAEANGLKTLAVRGTLVLAYDSDISNFTIKGESSHVARVEVAGGPTQGTSFDSIEVYGDMNGFIHCHHCHVEEITELRGHIHGSLIRGPLTLGGGQETVISDCVSGVFGLLTPIVNCGGSGQSFRASNYGGGIKITNITGADVKVSIDIPAGQAFVDSTCVNGEVAIRGCCDVHDSSGVDCNVDRTAAITNRSIWAELLINNLIAGSFGKLFQDMYLVINDTQIRVVDIQSKTEDCHDEAFGKWVLDPEALTLSYYRKDGTLLKKFDLNTTRVNILPIVGRVPQ